MNEVIANNVWQNLFEAKRECENALSKLLPFKSQSEKVSTLKDIISNIGKMMGEFE